MGMNTDGIWKVFRESGDPLCWLLYRAAERTGKKTENAGT